MDQKGHGRVVFCERQQQEELFFSIVLFETGGDGVGTRDL